MTDVENAATADVPEQIARVAGVTLTSGIGYTVTVYVVGAAGEQPNEVGIILKTTFCGEVPVLVITSLILPVPVVFVMETFEGSGSVTDHWYEVRVVSEVEKVAAKTCPEHLAIAAGVTVTSGSGFTFTLNVAGVAGIHPLPST